MDRLGPYVLLRTLGRGGMAEVFEVARADERGDPTGAPAALKRVAPSLRGDRAHAAMLLDEADVARSIVHENVLGVVEVGTDRGEPFIVYELVEGLDAGALGALGRAQGGVGDRVVAVLGHFVARGLHAAHTRRGPDGAPSPVVHRDVSPGNVLVGWDGAVLVADFGVAHARDRRERTATGARKGKPAYMAPEQLAGLAVDARADVFSLACALHAVATGRSPAPTLDALAGLLRGEPVTLDPSLGPALRAALDRALAARPGERYSDAAEFGAALLEAVGLRGETDDALVAELRAWLGPLRAQHERSGPAAAKFDSLFSLDFGLDHDEPSAPEPAPPPAAPPALTRRVKPGLRALVVVLLVVSALGAALRVAIELARSRPPTTQASAVAVPTSSTVDRALAVAPSSAPRALSSGALAPQTPSTLPPRTRERHTVSPASAPRVRGSAVSSVTVAAPSAAPSVEPPVVAPSFVRVGRAGPGSEPLRAFIDGRPVGWIPRVVSVAPGGHRLEVRREDGSVYGARSIDVAERHTRAAPLEALFE